MEQNLILNLLKTKPSKKIKTKMTNKSFEVSDIGRRQKGTAEQAIGKRTALLNKIECKTKYRPTPWFCEDVKHLAQKK